MERALARETFVLGLALCAMAGLADAVGYLTLSRILPANMSGNTVEGALGLLGAEGAGRKLWAVFMFTFGAGVSAVIHALGRRGRLRSPVAWALLAEVILLLGWVVLASMWHRELARHAPPFPLQYFVVLSLGALALGMQNASLTQVGPVHAFTTHVTGTLTKFAESAVDWMFSLRNKRTTIPASRSKDLQTALIMLSLWTVFFFGALAGGVLEARWGTHALLIPAAALLAIAGWTWRHPVKA